jgi:hypothetical protein
MNPLPVRSLATMLCVVGAALIAPLSPGAAPAQVVSGFDVFRSNCGGCHELYDPESPVRTREQWDEILTRMVQLRGATVSKPEQAAVLSYLDSFNRPKAETVWVEAPARSHTSTLAPADLGKLPLPWVELTPGADTPVPWAAQGDPAAKALFLSPLKTVSQEQVTAIIDNSGLVENGSIKTRLQVVSGRGALGAGVVFGYVGPQSFYSARLSPSGAALFEERGGPPTLLARAEMPLPQKQWHALRVDLAGGEVKISVNGVPIPELTRALPAYRAGRLGLHTQGDTVAVFDQWEVMIP